MKALFAGYGSIARRHVSNLRHVLAGRGEGLEVDLLRHAEAPKPEGVRLSTRDPEALDADYDAVFVTNPTVLHHATLLELSDLSDCFFVEKPVFDSSERGLEGLSLPGKVYYVACPLRYTAVLRWVARNVDFDEVNTVRCISSSYLPDWRPGADYRESYSARADMGGGVHVDLVHEWDYLCHLMGFPREVRVVMGRYSSLEVDSVDTALYVADYGDKAVEVHLDYHGRVPMRQLDIFAEEDTIRCDLIAGTVELLRANRTLDMREGRDDYQARELEHFLDIADGTAPSDNDLEFAVKVLRIAEGRWGE